MASSDINTGVVVGRLTKDAEYKTTQSGAKLLKFTIATNRMVKQNDEWTQKASFIDGTLWGNRADGLAPFMLKGKQIAVSYSIDQENWTDQQGNNRSKLAMIVNDIQLLGGKNEEEEARSRDVNEPTPTASANPRKKTTMNPNPQQSTTYQRRQDPPPMPANTSGPGPETFDDDDIPF